MGFQSDKFSYSKFYSMTRENNKERYSQVLSLVDQKGDGDMQAAKQDCHEIPTRDLNIWLCGRQTDFSVMGVRVDVPNFFFGQTIGETNTFQQKNFF